MGKKNTTKPERSDKKAEIIIVRHFGEHSFVHLYAEYVAGKILERAEEERKSA